MAALVRSWRRAAGELRMTIVRPRAVLNGPLSRVVQREAWSDAPPIDDEEGVACVEFENVNKVYGNGAHAIHDL